MSFAIIYQLLALHVLLTVPHELGHVVVARLIGVAVPEFGIGFPPTVAAIRWRGTRWSLNLLPVGAYVAFEMADVRQARRRSAIALAGPAANIVVALGSLAILILTTTASPTELVAMITRHLGSGAISWWLDELNFFARFAWPNFWAYLVDWRGFGAFLRLTISASIAVALVNLLPLPPLDGGKILLAALSHFGGCPGLERSLVRVGLVGIATLVGVGLVIALVGTFR